MRQPACVIVVSGGISFEREISLRSGHLVANTLHDIGLDVVTIDVDGGLLETIASLGKDIVVFMALHGAAGEDGSLQDVLDASDVCYVGSDGDSSRLAYDKPAAKYLAHRNAISTPTYAAVTQQTFRDLGTTLVLDRLGKKHGYPLMVKPARAGSAFGLSLVKDRAGLPLAMVNCFEHGDTALLESYVDGTEVSVGVIDSASGLTVLPPVEIVPIRDFYDFEAHYTVGETQYYTPARLPRESLDAVSAAAKTMHTVLGLRHISRSDFIIDRSGVPQFLEITASPGLTDTSIILQAMQAAGMTPSEVFAELACSALESHEEHSGNTANTH